MLGRFTDVVLPLCDSLLLLFTEQKTRREQPVRLFVEVERNENNSNNDSNNNKNDNM